jgi:hypothetical protein
MNNNKIYSKHSLRLKKNQLLNEYSECQRQINNINRIKKSIIQNITSKRGCWNKTAREIYSRIERDYQHKPEKVKKICQRFDKYFELDDEEEKATSKFEKVTLEIIEINDELENDSFDLYEENEELEMDEIFNL